MALEAHGRPPRRVVSCNNNYSVATAARRQLDTQCEVHVQQSTVRVQFRQRASALITFYRFCRHHYSSLRRSVVNPFKTVATRSHVLMSSGMLQISHTLFAIFFSCSNNAHGQFDCACKLYIVTHSLDIYFSSTIRYHSLPQTFSFPVHHEFVIRTSAKNSYHRINAIQTLTLSLKSA